MLPLKILPSSVLLTLGLLAAVVSGQQQRRVIGFDAEGRITIQGDRGRLGLRGSASSEFVPTLSKRDESEVIFPQEKQEQEGEVQTEALILDRLSGSGTLERQQTPRRLGGVLVANEQVVGPPCTARNGIIGDCRQLIKCVRFFFEIELLRSAPCPLPGGVRGVCCPHILVLREPEVEEDPWQKGCPSNIICPPKPPNVVIPNIRASDIRTASNIAKKNIIARQRLQASLFKKGFFTKKGTSAFGFSRFKQTNRFSTARGKEAEVFTSKFSKLDQKYTAGNRDFKPAGCKFQAGQRPGQVCPPHIFTEGVTNPRDLPVSSKFMRKGGVQEIPNTGWDMQQHGANILGKLKHSFAEVTTSRVRRRRGDPSYLWPAISKGSFSSLNIAPEQGK